MDGFYQNILDGRSKSSAFSDNPWTPLALGRSSVGVLIPKNTWSNREQYDQYLKNLIKQFKDNFKKFSVSEEIVAAGPTKINKNPWLLIRLVAP